MGKHPMGVDELRLHFLAGREMAERLRAFRNSRIEAINYKDLPVTLLVRGSAEASPGTDLANGANRHRPG